MFKVIFERIAGFLGLQPKREAMENANFGYTNRLNTTGWLLLIAVAGLYFLWPTIRGLLPARSAECLWTARLPEVAFAECIRPLYIAASPDGVAYVNCSFGSRVYVLDESGFVRTHWLVNSGEPTDSMPFSPDGLAVDTRGHALVLVTGAGKRTFRSYILRYTPNGKMQGRTACDFMSESLVTSGGYIYTRAPDGAIKQLAPNGDVVQTIGRSITDMQVARNAQVFYGRLVGVDSQDNFYMLYNGILQQVHRDGSPGWKLPNILSAIASPKGTLYVITRSRMGVEVARYTSQGKRVGRWRLPGVSAPECTAVDGKGNLYAGFVYGEVLKYRLPGDESDPTSTPRGAVLSSQLPAQVASAEGPDAEKLGKAILARAFEKLHRHHTFSATLAVTRMNFNMTAPITYAGSVLARKPNFLRVAVHYPKSLTLFVSDGMHYYVHWYDASVCLRSNVGKNPSDFKGLWQSEIDAFFGGRKLVDSGDVSYAGTEMVNGIECDLVRVSTYGNPATINYAIGRRDNIIYRGACHLSFGGDSDDTTMLLTNIRYDIPISQSRFTYRPSRPLPIQDVRSMPMMLH